MSDDKPKIVAMVQQSNLILVAAPGGRQYIIHVGGMIYASLLAEAINKVTLADE